MGLLSRHKQDAWVDPATVSPDDALRHAREATAKTGAYWNGSGRRRVSPEQRAQMDAIFNCIEAARGRS